MLSTWRIDSSRLGGSLLDIIMNGRLFSTITTGIRVQPRDPSLRKIIIHGSTFSFTKEFDSACGRPDIVLVALHGSVGSHRDFRYIAGAFDQIGSPCEFVRLDLPGYGQSDARTLGYPTTENCSARVWDALSVAFPGRKLVLLAHSLAGHLITDMVARPIHAESAKSVVGLVYLSSIGLRPHFGVGGSLFFPVLQWAARNIDHPIWGDNVSSLLHFSYTRLAGFPVTTKTEDIVFGHRRVAALNFPEFRKQLAATGRDTTTLPPCFVAYAEDDHMIEVKVSEELVTALPEGGPRLVWKTGGHNIQKSHSLEIATALKEWILYDLR